MAAKLLKTLVLLLSSIALLLAAANTARSEGTDFNHYFSGEKSPDLIYQGDAYFPSNTSPLRLTKTSYRGIAQPYSVGRVVHASPVIFWEAGGQADLETTITFKITPNHGDNNPADGFTFFIEPVNSTVGFTGGSYGIFDRNGKRPNVFAVEFDIFPNPGVDPSYRHIGIDIESNVSKNVTEVDDALLGQEVSARINYEEATKVISVHVMAGSKTYEVRYVYDLSTILPQQVQVGISAATGGEVAVHDLISWNFISTIVRRGDNIRQVV